MNRVTLYTRADCKLCNGAMYVIKRVRRGIPFELDYVDIAAAGNEHWLQAYGNDIPVVHLNGTEIFRHRVDERRLRELLEGRSRTD